MFSLLEFILLVGLKIWWDEGQHKRADSYLKENLEYGTIDTVLSDAVVVSNVYIVLQLIVY